MKMVPAALMLHVQGSLTTLSMCWKLTRRDGVILAFTEAATDLFINGLNYLSVAGFEPSAIDSSADMSVDNLEIDGLLNSGAFTAADISAGVYNDAKVSVFYVNRRSIGDGILQLTEGTTGQITTEQGRFKAEVRGALQPFQQSIISLFSKTCPATLGDGRCRADMTGKTVTGSITTLLENRGFTDSARTEPASYFAYGKVTFLTGACAGLTIEVKHFNGGLVELLIPMPRPLLVGNAYRMTAGCDRSVATCRDKFNNILNFQGFPDIPDPTSVMYPV